DDCDGPNSMLGAWFGHRSLKEIPQLVSTANPINYVNEKCPPFIFLHGSRDRQVPLLQSWNLAAALIAAIGKDKVEHHVIKGAEHSIYDFETEEIYSLEEAFLKKHL
ncbi:MAG: prolyl oligopeptidase family serine peptidase, partial [Oscillospiraceae bacterium]